MNRGDQGPSANSKFTNALMPNLKSSILYPSRRNNERCRDQANKQIEKFYEIFKDISFEISFTDALILMPKFASTLKALIGNKEKLSEMARTPINEHCSAYMPSFKKALKVCEAKTVKSFVDEPPEVELKDLPPHLEYAFLEGDNKLPIIIAKELGDEEKSALIKVLKSHKRPITWKLSNIQAEQHQRRVKLKIHDVIKKEVEKLLDAGLIYPSSDSPWVSPTMEVFVDDFSVFRNSFENCLSRLDKMLQ
nr:reverse transcriptase domain-containing protein [Tanacetum cinerariifolium]